MDIRVDALRLRVGGIGEDPARRLAALIAERLGAALPHAAGAGELGGLGVTLQAQAGDTLDSLADSAAAQVLHALSAPGGSAGTTARRAAT